MKKEINGKEYNIKNITLGDVEEFGDYLKQEKIRIYSQYAKKQINDDTLEPEMQSILKQIGLQTNIDIELLKGLEQQLKQIQSSQNMIMKILEEPTTFGEILFNINSLKGGRYFIWLAIRDNGVKFEDMDSIVHAGNFREIVDMVKIVGMEKEEKEEKKKKNDQTEAESPSPSS